MRVNLVRAIRIFQIYRFPFWIVVFPIFSLSVLTFGNIDLCSQRPNDADENAMTKRRLHLHGMRLATASVGFLMGLIVFVGALHLESKSSSAIQTFWTGVYFACVAALAGICLCVDARDKRTRGYQLQASSADDSPEPSRP